MASVASKMKPVPEVPQKKVQVDADFFLPDPNVSKPEKLVLKFSKNTASIKADLMQELCNVY